jgi:hypothetical protein
MSPKQTIQLNSPSSNSDIKTPKKVKSVLFFFFSAQPWIYLFCHAQRHILTVNFKKCCENSLSAIPTASILVGRTIQDERTARTSSIFKTKNKEERQKRRFSTL